MVRQGGSGTVMTLTQNDLETLPRDAAQVTVEMLSQPRYLCGARDLVSAIAKRLGFDEASCGQVALAVDEALSNIIRHGYHRAPNGRIWMRIWPIGEVEDGRAEGIKIVIEDEASQIDPARIRGRDLDDVRPGGLGVYIIRNVMDAAKYERREEGGMRLILGKRLQPRQVGPAA